MYRYTIVNNLNTIHESLKYYIQNVIYSYNNMFHSSELNNIHNLI